MAENNKPEKVSLMKWLTTFNRGETAQNVTKTALLAGIITAGCFAAITSAAFLEGGMALVASMGLTATAVTKAIIFGMGGAVCLGLIADAFSDEKETTQEAQKSTLKQSIKNNIRSDENSKQAVNFRDQQTTQTFTYKGPEMTINFAPQNSALNKINSSRSSQETPATKIEKPKRQLSPSGRQRPPSAQGRKDYIR